jgi:hypothetical protein
MLLASNNMFGLHTMMFSKVTISHKIENISTSKVEKGTKGAKGAVSIRFKIYD